MRACGPHPGAAGSHRSSARHFGAAGSRQGIGFRGGGGPSGLSAACAFRALRTATRAAIQVRGGRLYRSGRTMASRKLLIIGSPPPYPPPPPSPTPPPQRGAEGGGGGEGRVGEPAPLSAAHPPQISPARHTPP